MVERQNAGEGACLKPRRYGKHAEIEAGRGGIVPVEVREKIDSLTGRGR